MRSGTSYKVVCDVKGTPVPHVTWKTKTDDVLLESDYIKTMRDEASATLILNNVKRPDSNNLVLTASNSEGSASETLYLNVVGN